MDFGGVLFGCFVCWLGVFLCVFHYVGFLKFVFGFVVFFGHCWVFVFFKSVQDLHSKKFWKLIVHYEKNHFELQF